MSTTFKVKADYGAGLDLIDIVDLNGDGRPDIVGPNGDTDFSRLEVFLNQGNGTFGTRVDYVTGNRPESFNVADLNNDGKPDVITGNVGSSTASVFLNQGNGTFATKVDYVTLNFPVSVSVADVNNDDKPDFVVFCDAQHAVSVFLNQGSGTFATKVDYPIWGRRAILVDVNNDDKPDIVASYAMHRGAAVSVLLNQGSGIFGTLLEYQVGGICGPIKVVDVNGDGKSDIITANYPNTTSVLLNQGNGIFGVGADYVTSTSQCSNGCFSLPPQSISVIDINSDDKPDIVTAHIDTNMISVLINQGDGTFGTREEYATGIQPRSVSVVDINGDGKPDIVTANFVDRFTAGTVSVLINQGNGTFATRIDYATGAGARLASIVDINGDGKQDIVTVNWGTISVLLGTCSGITEAGASCIPCTTNQYTTDHITCQLCYAGNYLDANPGTSCTPCAVGSISTLGSTSCTPCQINQYTTDHITCQTCVAGNYLDANPGSSCTPCPSGTYAALSSAVGVCNNPAAGFYTNDTKSVIACPTGTYNVGGTPASGCTSCPTNHYTIDHVTCQLCPAGNYLDANPGSSCTPCPSIPRSIVLTGNNTYFDKSCDEVFYINKGTKGTITLDLCEGGHDVIKLYEDSPDLSITIRCLNSNGQDRLELIGLPCIDNLNISSFR